MSDFLTVATIGAFVDVVWCLAYEHTFGSTQDLRSDATPLISVQVIATALRLLLLESITILVRNGADGLLTIQSAFFLGLLLVGLVYIVDFIITGPNPRRWQTQRPLVGLNSRLVWSVKLCFRILPFSRGGTSARQ